MSTSNPPIIILVRPQLGENIGMCMRAMINCGMTRLRLVAPRDGWPSASAERAASGAYELMNEIAIFDTVEKAIADCHTVFATTARARELNKPHSDLNTAVTKASKETTQGAQIAFAFGCERTGLDNQELSLMHHLVTIPLNDGFTSLNLAQAVLLVCHALWDKFRVTDSSNISEETPPAPMDEIVNLCNRLETELEANHFFREENLKPTMVNNIRTMLTRANLSEQEVRTFHGIISALIGKKNN